MVILAITFIRRLWLLLMLLSFLLYFDCGCRSCCCILAECGFWILLKCCYSCCFLIVCRNVLYSYAVIVIAIAATVRFVVHWLWSLLKHMTRHSRHRQTFRAQAHRSFAHPRQTPGRQHNRHSNFGFKRSCHCIVWYETHDTAQLAQTLWALAHKFLVHSWQTPGTRHNRHNNLFYTWHGG